MANTPSPSAGFKVQPAQPGADPTKQSSQKLIVSAPFQISPLGQRTPYIKLLVYAPHGLGKTTLAGSSVDCEPMRDVLMIDAESGELAIRDNPRIRHSELISHIHVTSFKQVAYIHQFLQAHCIHRDKDTPQATQQLKENESKVTGTPVAEIDVPKRYRTVIIDSLTEVDQYSLYKLQGMDQANLTEDPESIDVARFEEFRKNNEMVKMLVRAFRDLPMNVIFCCSAQYNQNERKQYHYSPAMTGKLSAQIQGMVDIVGYMIASPTPNDNGEYPRALLVQPGEYQNAKYDAKNRRAQYKDVSFADPTMEKIMRLTGMLK